MYPLLQRRETAASTGTAQLTPKSYGGFHSLHRREFPCGPRYCMRYVSQIFAWLLPGYSSLIQAVEDFWRIRLQRRSRGRYLSQSVVRPFNDSGRHVNGPAHRWSKSVPGGAMTHKKYYQSDTA